MTETGPNLDAAYSIKTPADNQRIYADWAESYDANFAQAMDYVLPDAMAAAFIAAGGMAPVLDLGAGTGLLGTALQRLGLLEIDGTDISQEMLTVAAAKQVYQRVFIGDLTARLPVADASYNGVISAGTFTTGHVGPAALDEVLRVARAGAVIGVTINAKHWKNAGFVQKFEALTPKITDFILQDVAIYGTHNTSNHKDDIGRIALFRKR
ncbi:MAG: class I SAM-dependent methyltransferase [Paracoccaceae bacterium]|nr:class I SAM-dependent methyltransferase [Paracoccaceae bacterium]